MHIVILASENPRFDHLSSTGTVLASLLETFAKMGHNVSYATAACPHPVDPASFERLKNQRIHFVGDFSDDLFSPHKIVKSVLSFIKDFPVFRNPKKVISRLHASGAEVFLLFWDTIFHHLLPFSHGTHVVGYFGKAPYSSAQIRFSQSRGIFKYLRLGVLRQREHRYLARSHFLNRVSNICLLDTAYYNHHGIPCEYISNTWPDSFGEDWYTKRAAEERKKIAFLANIGTVNTTGNTFGLQFLAEKILPHLDNELSGIDWEINICGGGKMAEPLFEKLRHPRVNMKGFVPDIDTELLQNQIFLLLNNAGPYTGGYTRVIYAFSSGACLIAYENLALSMPEVKHMKDALLGRTAEEIIHWMREAARDPALRRKIGEGARQTYENEFHPTRVAEKIISLI